MNRAQLLTGFLVVAVMLTSTTSGRGDAIDSITDLGTSTATDGSFSGSAALAINNQGLIVGENMTNGTTAPSAFISDGGMAPIDLNSLISPTAGWHLLEATSINDQGQITAIGQNSLGVIDALLLNPLPGVGIDQIRAAIDSSSSVDPIVLSPPIIVLKPSPAPEPSTVLFFAAIAGVIACRAYRAQRCSGGSIRETLPSASMA